MGSWSEVEKEAPELAELARARLEAHGLGLLATLRADGSPRISGVEVLFSGGELWLGMMDGSRKAADLLRDPRCSLHNATVDREVTEGDVKVSGVAVEVTDDREKEDFATAFAEHTGNPVPEGPYHLFRIDVTELVAIRPGGDHLDIDTWHEGRGVSHVDRY